MNVTLVNRLINLVRRTGHKVVFGDPETGEAVVVMDLSEYEQLIGAVAEKPELEAYEPLPAVSQPVSRTPVQPTRREQPRIDQSPTAPKEESSSAPKVQPKRAEVQQTNRHNNLTGMGAADNINRDIGGQKANQGNQVSDNRPLAKTPEKPVNQTTVHPPKPEVPAYEPNAGLDDEERFYLEPLE
ncbi:MAG: hypothetical protein V1738_04600 [Patescibacteria group bacterium]